MPNPFVVDPTAPFYSLRPTSSKMTLCYSSRDEVIWLAGIIYIILIDTHSQPFRKRNILACYSFSRVARG